MKNRMKHPRRYQEIMNTFMKNGLSHILFRLGITEKQSRTNDKTEATSENLTNIGVKLRNSLQSLGPTFIKLGQIASSRRDLVPKEIALELEKLQDHVQTFPYDKVAEIIETQLGGRPEDVFKQFNHEPLASASIGQVHIAQLSHGEKVAVKVQRPDIEATIKTDLEILNDIVRFLDDKFEWARNYRIKDIIDEFAYSLRNELNYLLEGRNGERIARQLKEYPEIHIPKIHWQYTSEKVLTMEMVEGIKVNHYDSLRAQGYDTKLIANNITEAMLHQILESGYFHGDPHPGNIFVLPDNRVALLDFGMIGHLSEAQKYYFSSLIIYVNSNDTEGIIRTFDEWGLLEDVTEMAALRRDIDSLQLKYYDVELSQISLGKVMIEIFAIAYKHKIRIPTDISILAKVILTLESLLENLDPQLSIMKAIEPYGKKLIMKRFNPKNIATDLGKKWVENFKLMTDLPKELKEISSTIKKGKLQFDINIFKLQDILHKLDRITNRISFSIILLAFSILMAGLIIGSSIAGQTTFLFKIPILEVGFVIATLMFLFLAFSIFKSGRM